jgi:hypothetical protein
VHVLDRADVSAPLARPSEKASWLYSLSGVAAAVLLYSALHVGARLVASSNLGEDDPLDAIRSQALEPGYSTRQPPLYNWAIWLIEQVTGPGALSFQLLKYGLLTATCAFIFLSARRAMKGDAFWAFLSVEALALIYQISWRFHEGFTHAVGAMCAVAGALWAMLRLIERRGVRDYALFGVVAGLGLLTVTTFWVYLAALIGAALLQPSARRSMLRPQLGLSLLVAATIASPYLIWLAGTPEGLGALFPEPTIGQPGHVEAMLKGLRRALTEPVMYLAPLIFLYPLFFPAYLKTVAATVRLAPRPGGPADPEQLILHLTLLNLAALLAGAIIFGIHSYAVHALMPLFLVTAIWLTAQARKAVRSAAEIRRFVILALCIAAFAFAARCANMFVLSPVCNICRWGTPYAELADALKARGFEGGRIAVVDDEIGGNLRRFFPDAAILLGGARAYIPPHAMSRPGGRLALIWDARDKPDRVLRQFQAALPRLSAEAIARAEPVSIPWRDHYWKPDGYRVSEWRVLILGD